MESVPGGEEGKGGDTKSGRYGRALASLLMLCVILAFSLAPFDLPEATSEEAPPADFSALRALKHVPVMAGEIRSTASTDVATVRDYLSRELQGMGLQPERQRRLVHHGRGVVEVDNVMVRLKGTAPSGAVLILSPLSSAPYGEEGGGVVSSAAILMETVRALHAGPRLKNDVITLFDDRRELGCLGGKAFAVWHPWSADVRAAVALGTGARGPLVLSWAGPANGRLIRQLAGADRGVVASSFLTPWLSRVTHNTGGLQPFLELGVPSYALENMSPISEEDTARGATGRLNPGSLQRMGEQTLALARRLGEADLERIQAPDAVFFSIWRMGILLYPVRRTPHLVVSVSLLLAAAVALGFRRHELTGRGLGGAMLAFVTLLAGLSLSVGLAWKLVRAARFWGSPQTPQVLPTEAVWVMVGSVCVGVVVASGGYWWARRHWSRQDLAWSALLAWWAALGVTSILCPGMSYVMIWPLASGGLAWAVAFLTGAREGSIVRWILLWLPVIPAVVLAVPNLYVICLVSGFLPALAGTGTAVAVAGILLPQLEDILGGSGLTPATCISRCRRSRGPDLPL